MEIFYHFLKGYSNKCNYRTDERPKTYLEWSYDLRQDAALSIQKSRFQNRCNALWFTQSIILPIILRAGRGGISLSAYSDFLAWTHVNSCYGLFWTKLARRLLTLLEKMYESLEPLATPLGNIKSVAKLFPDKKAVYGKSLRNNKYNTRFL